MPFMCVWLRLTIMKLASRKNMISIKGMISIRALLCGTGEETFIYQKFQRSSVLGACHRERDGNFDLRNRTRLKPPLPKGTECCVIQYRISGASMASSTGNPILDNAALSAFRQWRFKPGSVSKVKIPITFTMTGAQY